MSPTPVNTTSRADASEAPLAAPVPGNILNASIPLNVIAVRAGMLGALVVAAMLAIAWQYRAVTDGYVTDDAYISFRYARNLADGFGPVWSPGDRIEGYTNFGWVLVIAIGIKAGIDPLDMSRAAGALATAGTLALIPALAAQLRSAWTRAWWIVVTGAAAAFALNTGTATWTFAGLETPAVAFFVTLGATLHLYEERAQVRRPVWSSLAFAAGAIVRPDAAVAFAVTGLFKLRRLHLEGERMRQLFALSACALAFAVPFGIYWIWRWSYYGDFYPNTYYLKTGAPFEVAERGWAYVAAFGKVYSVWLLLPAVIAAWREDVTKSRPVLYLLAVFAAWFAYVAYAGGDWMPYFRFFVPVLAIMYVLAIHGAIEVIEVLRRAPRSATVATIAGVVFAGIVAVTAFVPRDLDAGKHPPGVQSEILQGNVEVNTHSAIGLWMRENIPSDYYIAQIATGIVPYYSQLPTIDMLGVNDRHIAHLDVPIGKVAAGHEKHDGGYVLSRKPEFIWLGLAIEQAPRDTITAYELEQFPGPVWTEVTQNAYVWFLYRPVAVQIREGWINLLVRQDVELPWLPKGVSRIDAR